LWEHLLVGQAEDSRASQETEHSRDQIVELAFAAPGGAGAWSEAGKSHAHAEYQPSEQIANDVS